MKRCVVSLMMVVAVSMGAYAQSLEETMQKLAKDAAMGYVQPIASGFGANLNSGWMYRAPQATVFGLDVDFGIVVMGSFMADDAKKFSRSGTFTFDSLTAAVITSGIANTAVRDSAIRFIRNTPLTVTISGPTIVGSKDSSVRVSYSGGDQFSFGTSTYNFNPAGQVLPVQGYLEDIPLLPLAAPQLSLGTIYGTKVILRYLPELDFGKIPKVSYFGFGIQHNPFMWIPVPEPPLDVSLGFFTQTLKIGSIFESKATMVGVQASKTFGPGVVNITPYFGLSVESSSMSVTYNFPDQRPGAVAGSTIPVSFSLDGENTTRLTIGLSLKLAIFKLNADYNIAKFNTISGGLGIII